MFEVDEELYAAFSGIVSERYINRKCLEFAEAHPENLACAGADNVKKFMQLVWEKAEKYNIPTDREFNILSSFMLYWGCDFDVDPQYPWARFKRFADAPPYIAPIDRLKDSEPLRVLKEVHAKFYDFFKATIGEDYSYLIAAYERICKLQFSEFVCLNSANDILLKMQAVYPQRYDYMPQKTLREFVLPEAQKKAFNYELDPKIGTALCAGLIFCCGISFDTDPLYIAVNKELAKPFLPGMQKEQFLLNRLKTFAANNLRGFTKEGESHNA